MLTSSSSVLCADRLTQAKLYPVMSRVEMRNARLRMPHTLISLLTEGKECRSSKRPFRFSNVRPDDPRILALPLYTPDAPSGLPTPPEAQDEIEWPDLEFDLEGSSPAAPQGGSEADHQEADENMEHGDKAPAPKKSALKRKRTEPEEEQGDEGTSRRTARHATRSLTYLQAQARRATQRLSCSVRQSGQRRRRDYEGDVSLCQRICTTPTTRITVGVE